MDCIETTSSTEVNNKRILMKYLFHAEMSMVLMQPQPRVTRATALIREKVRRGAGAGGAHSQHHVTIRCSRIISHPHKQSSVLGAVLTAIRSLSKY